MCFKTIECNEIKPSLGIGRVSHTYYKRILLQFLWCVVRKSRASQIFENLCYFTVFSVFNDGFNTSFSIILHFSIFVFLITQCDTDLCK